MARLGRSRPASSYRTFRRLGVLPPGTVQLRTGTVTVAAGAVTPSGNTVTVTLVTAAVTVAAGALNVQVIPPFPASTLNLLVELNVGGTWTDISGYVYQRAPVAITRGRPDETSSASPSSLTLTLDNRDGRFTPRNPSGAYFGLIGRNTQIRVSAQNTPAIPFTYVYRCWLEVPEWPPRWDPTGTDVYTEITASGVLRRLGQNQNLRSPMFRYYAGLASAAQPLAYWPGEDGSAAASLVSGLAGGFAMPFAGTAQLASDSSFTCSDGLPQCNGATFTGLTGASGSIVAVSQDVFSTGGTWTAPAGITQVLAEKWGAGGGGSGTSGGGGGGEYASDVQPVTPGSGYAVAVGTSSVGAAGGSSSFTGDGGIRTANGGHAGSGSAGGAGGTGSTSTTHFSGGAGSAGTAPAGPPTTPGSQTFTANGTWTEPSAIVSGSATVYLWGAGGGAGWGSSNGGGGGGGGGFSSVSPSVSGSGSHPIVVGTGGTGGTSTVSSTDGGDSKFDGASTGHGGQRGTGGTFGNGGAGNVHSGGGGGFAGGSNPGSGGGGAGSLGGNGGGGISGSGGGAGGAGGSAGGLVAGGKGGAGGTSGAKSGKAGAAPGGGGGGNYNGGGTSGGGATGRVEVFWTENSGGGTPAVGGGGGGSGGTASVGTAGGTQAGAPAVAGGGPGGGVLSGSAWAAAPVSGPGGGGGGVDAGGPARAGAAGQVRLTYAPAGTGTGAAANVLRFLLHLGTSVPDGTVIAQLFTTGTLGSISVIYGTGGTLTLTGFNTGGGQLFTSGPVAFKADGALLLVSAELVTAGSAVTWQLTGFVQGQTTAATITPASASGSLGSATLGNPFAVVINPSGLLTDTGFGHVAVLQSYDPVSDLQAPFAAWSGETAAARFTRLCGEQSIPATIVGTAADTNLVGPQTIAQLVTLLQDCEDADQGLIFEPRNSFGLAYRTRVDLCNQAPAVTLNYAAADLAADLVPVYDDQKIGNDWTVSRPNGSSNEQVLAAGPMSVLDPPDGVSSYTKTKSANVATDQQLPDLTSWLLHTSTVDENRYPVILLNLARPESADNFTDLATVDIGDRIVIQNPPPWLPPEQISQLAFGTRETLNAYQWDIGFSAVPGSVYEVAEAGTTDRLGTDGSLLGTGIGTGDLTFSVTTPSPNAPWVSTAGQPAEFPFDITVSGEQMTVTAITSATTPQVFTVTRSVNGVAKAHSAGEAIDLTSPAIVSL